MVTYRYRVVVEQDEDGVYVASCPALQGCYAQGDTYTELALGHGAQGAWRLRAVWKQKDRRGTAVSGDPLEKPKAPLFQLTS